MKRQKQVTWGHGLLVCVVALASLITPATAAASHLAGQDAGPQLVLPAAVDPARWGTALCNDGTPFGFMLEPSPDGSKNWVVYLEGGGFCDDFSKDCSERSDRMSTTPGPEAIEDYYRTRGLALFSSSSGWNPSFYNANKVYAFYCSSDVWSGSTTERRPTTADPNGWYFSGRSNVRALFEVLKAVYGLDDAHAATRVLYAGGSAGGQGVQATADLAAQILPRTARSGRLKLLNDAGSVFHFSHPDYSFDHTGLTFKQVIMQAYQFWGSALNPLCEKAQVWLNKPPAECFDEAIVVPFTTNPRPSGLGLPLFVQQSSIDGWQLKMHGIREDPEGTEIFRGNTLAQFAQVSWTWLWSAGEFSYHVVTIKDEYWTMGPPGQTFRDVLSRYWDGYPPEVVVYGNP